MIVQCADCKTRYQLERERVPREQIRVRCPKCAYVFGIDGSRIDEVVATQPPVSGPAATVSPDRGFEATSGAVTPVREFGEVQLDSRPVAPAPPRQPAAQAWPEPTPTPVASSPPPSSDSGMTSTEDFVIERSTGPRLGSPSAVASPEAFGLEDRSAESGFTSTLAPPEPQRASRAVPHAAPSAPAADPQDEKARRLARALVSDILVYNRDVRDKALADGNLVQAMGQEIKKSWELYKEKVTPDVANSTNHFREALNAILANGQQIF